jgi:hypothetical protein
MPFTQMISKLFMMVVLVVACGYNVQVIGILFLT